MLKSKTGKWLTMKHLLTGSAIGVSALFCHGMIENKNENILNGNKNIIQNENSNILSSNIKDESCSGVFTTNDDKEIELETFFKVLNADDLGLKVSMLNLLPKKLAEDYCVFIRDGMKKEVLKDDSWFFKHFYDVRNIKIGCSYDELMKLLSNINAFEVKKIDIGGCKFSANEWTEIAKKLPQVIQMDLYGSNVDGATVVEIFKLCPMMKKIDIGNCKDIDDKCIRGIVEIAGQRIETFCVRSCKNITLKALQYISLCGNLEEIDLSNIPTTQEWIPYLKAIIVQCKNLKFLRVDYKKTSQWNPMFKEYEFKIIRAKGFGFYIDNLKLINKIGAEDFYEKKCKSNDNKIESKIENKDLNIKK